MKASEKLVSLQTQHCIDACACIHMCMYMHSRRLIGVDIVILFCFGRIFGKLYVSLSISTIKY